MTPSPSTQALADQLAQQTLELCRIPSVTGDEAAIADALQARCLQLGATTSRIGHTVIAQGPLRPGLPVVVLLGHSDTVRPAPVEQQPLEIRAQEGRVYGCGASDMKGGLAVMLQLLASAAQLPAANLLCIFYDQEEGPAAQSGILPLCAPGGLLRQGLPGLAPPSQWLAFCLEPTDNQIHAGCVGSLQALVTAVGKRAHSARPWHGHNAIYAALPLLTKLRDTARHEVSIDTPVGPLRFYEVVSATQARTENSRNVVPDRLVLNINARFAPGKSVAEAKAQLLALIGPDYEVGVVDEAPSGAVSLAHPLLQPWLQSAGLVVEAKQAWTDVARLTDLGLQAVNFGPGDTAQAHQAGESCSILALLSNYAAFCKLLT